MVVMVSKKYLYILVFIFSYFHIGSVCSHVDHKQDNMDKYLQDLNFNLPEKIKIVEYINKNKKGVYLELGSGGDSIGEIVDNVDPGLPLKIIVADLDDNVLKSIPKRYPEINKYIENTDKNKLSVELVHLDATNLYVIETSTIQGINASALAHEVHSYSSSKSGLDQFFLESARVLDENGMLIYRDPILQDDAGSPNILVLKESLYKMFVTLLFPKLLDIEFTKIKDMYGNSIKPDFSYTENTTINLHLKHERYRKSMTVAEFIGTPSRHIDFNQDISVVGPRRILSEIERHYVLFLKDVYPCGFIDSTSLQEGKLLSDITPDLARTSVRNFSTNLGVNFGEVLDNKDVSILTMEKDNIREFINRGVEMESTSLLSSNISELFHKKKVDHALYKINDNMIWLDAKLLMLLYNGQGKGILDKFTLINSNENKLPFISMDWLRREGEEYYYYLSMDEFLDYLYRLSDFYFDSIGKGDLMFCPINSDSGVVVSERYLYKNILERDSVQIDMQGEKQDFVVSKAIVNLQLMKKEKAIEIYKKIIANNPDKYTILAASLVEGQHFL